ncbi:DoxX family membrane protein [Corallococcus terminator]|uniref:DoxX family membrane protein n=1 Tax=Corallococcus terminator TaxID=2316733 RepID=A0A3A8JCC2_9BACT|nr:DoxX family membrane protein [Corallococcus terminator]RKG89490.1 DoxX family membrane protein [Corallococcus terminator]
MGTATPSRIDAVEAQPKKSLTRFLPTVARVLMGALFLFAGLNGFLNFVPPPAKLPPEGAMAFSKAMMDTGYLFQLVKGTEVLVAVLLLANRFVPLALALIAPVLVNIFAFHAFLAPEGTGLAVVLLAIEIFLAWTYRAAFRPMLAMRATPSVTTREAP